MRSWKLGWMCAAVVLTASISTGVMAQQPGQPGGGGGGRGGFGQGRFGGRMGGPLTIVMVPVDVLTKELKLSDEQQAKIEAYHQKMQQDMQAARPADGTQPDFQAMQAKFQEINQQATKDIEGVLTPEQKAKTPALLKTLGTLRSVGIPIQTYGDLKLTGEQKTKLATLAAEVDKDRAQKMQDMQAARQAGDQDKMREIMQSLRGAGGPNEKALAILTTSQKEIVEKYVKEHPQRGFGGGRRQGGGAPPPQG